MSAFYSRKFIRIKPIIRKTLCVIALIVLCCLYEGLVPIHLYWSTLTAKYDSKLLCNNNTIYEASIRIKSNVQSTWKCSGNMNYQSEWRWRTCVFKNICYDKKNKRFEFYRTPGSPKRPILFEPKLGHIYDFNIDNHGFVSLISRPNNHQSWGPTIVEKFLPSSDRIPYLDQAHVLFMHWYAPYNPGHIIWEDLASTYLAMMRLDEYDSNAVLLRFENIWPKGNIYESMYNSIVPAFASKVEEVHRYMDSFATDTICFRRVVAGGGTPMFSLDNEHLTSGKERYLYGYRTAILQYHGVDLSKPPTRHRIILVNKTASRRPALRAIKNLPDVLDFIQQTYPTIEVNVVEWHKMTFTEQMKELYKTTILITPPGGVSCIVPFLPKGAHAIIMDYYVNEKAHLPGERWNVGESASMDAGLWNYFPHIRKLYYQVRGLHDFEFVPKNATDSRHDVTIVINMDRLKELIDTAIENSDEYKEAARK